MLFDVRVSCRRGRTGTSADTRGDAPEVSGVVVGGVKIKSRLLLSDTGTSATKAEHEMSRIKKKKKSFPATVEKKKRRRSSHAAILPFGVDLIGAGCIFMK